MKGRAKAAVIALLAALVLLAGTIVAATAATTDIVTSSTKTASWVEGQEGEALQIDITESQTGGTMTPKILFLGSLCDQHGLSLDTINNALAACAQYGDVEYHFFSTGDTMTDTKTAQSGNISMGASLADVKAKNITMHMYYHATLYDFASVLASIDADDYDFIVLEFDGFRLGHTQSSASTSQMSNLKAAATVIQKFYDKDKVAWIIPSTSLDTNKDTVRAITKVSGSSTTAISFTYDSSNVSRTGTYMYRDLWFDSVVNSNDAKSNTNFLNYTINDRNEMYLLAPEDVTKNGADKSGNVLGMLSDYTTFIDRASNTGSDSIWVDYSDPDKVRLYLEDRLSQVKVKVTDVVRSGLTVTKVVGQYKASGSDAWIDIDSTDTDKFSYTSEAQADGSTKLVGNFDTKLIYGSSYSESVGQNLRMHIECSVVQTDPNASDYIFTKGSDGTYSTDTNVGDAEVEFNNGPVTTVIMDSTPSLTADVETVSYQFVGDAPSDATAPDGTKVLKGGTYTATQPAAVTGYTFDGWYTDEDCTKAFTDGSTISADTTLYGKWVKDLTIAKAADSTTVTAGGDITYTITVTNNTASAMSNLTITDALPSGLTFKSADNDGTCTNGTVTWTGVSVAANSTTDLKVTATTAGTYTEDTTISNTASVKNEDNGDTDESKPSEVTVEPKSLTVSYEFSGTDAPKGATAPKAETTAYGSAYTAATQASVDGWTFDGWYTSDGTKYVDATKLTSDTTLTGKWTWGISVAKALTSPDYGKPTAGDSITYTIRVTNSTASAVSGLTVTDAVPAGLTFKSADNGGTCTDGTVTWTGVSVEADSHKDVTVTFATDGTLSKATDVENIAGVADPTNGGSAESEPVKTTVNPRELKVTYEYAGNAPESAEKPSDATVTYDGTYTAATQTPVAGWSFDGWYTDADCTTKFVNGSKITDDTKLYGLWTWGISIAKKAGSETVTAGGDITYTITITNKSADTVSDLAVTDIWPDDLTYKSSSDDGVYVDGNVCWKGISVAGNSSKDVTVTGTTKADYTASGSVANSAEVTDGNGGGDETDSVEVAVDPQQFDVTYEFEGDDTPSTVTVPTKETVDYGTKYDAADDPVAPGWNFDGWYTEDGKKYEDGTPITGNTVLTGKWTFAVSVAKQADKTTVTAGGDITYTITVKNDSASEVTGLKVEDTLPTGVTYKSASDKGSCTDGTVTWTDITVAANSTKDVTVTVTADDVSASASIANKAKVTDPTNGGTDESESSDVTVDPRSLDVSYSYEGDAPGSVLVPTTESVTYGTEYDAADKPTASGWNFDGWYTDEDCTQPYTDGTAITDDMTLHGKWSYGVKVSKVANTQTAHRGDIVTYTITVSNSTASAVTGYTVTDKLDEDLYCLSCSTTSATGSIGYIGGAVTASNQTIPAADASGDGTITITIEAKINANLSGEKTIKNIAVGSGIEGDPEPQSESDVAVGEKDITVNYSYVGDVPDGATAPTDTDTHDYGSTLTAKDGSATDLTNSDWWTFSGWYTDEALTEPFDSSKALTNENYASLDNGGDTLTLYGGWTPVQKYTVVKTVSYGGVSTADDSVFMNSTVTYTITVTNQNPEAAATIDVTDEVPAGLQLVDGSISDGGSYSATNGTITWSNLSVAAGGSKDLTFNATVPNTITEPTAYKNVAYVSASDGEDFDGEGGKDTNPGTVEFTGMPTVSPEVKATWSDSWDSHPDDTIYVNVYADGEFIDAIELTKDDPTWSDTLPQFDDDGNKIDYTFIEYRPGDYEDTELDDGEIYSEYKTPGDYKVGYASSEDGTTTTITHTYQVQPSDFEFTKATDAPENPEAGSTFTYTLTLKNTRTETANDVVVTDEVPEGLIILTEAGEGIEIDGQTVTWTIDEIAGGAEQTLQIEVQIPEDADAVEYTNVAQIVSVGDTDPQDPQDPQDSNPAKTTVRTFTVSKQWFASDGTKVESDGHAAVTIQLLQNGEPYGDPITLSSDNEWTYTWNALPLYDGNGTPYAYTVSEAAVDGYSWIADYTAAKKAEFGNASATVKNTLKTIQVGYQYVGEVPDGVTAPDGVTVDYGTAFTGVDPDTNDYYVVVGWYTDEECTTPFEPGTVLDDSNTTDGSLTLYAKWTHKTVKVTFDQGTDGPDVEVPDDLIVYQGDKAIVKDLTDATGKFKFDGWYLDPEFTIPFDPDMILDDSNTTDGELHLYPKWTKVEEPASNKGTSNNGGNSGNSGSKASSLPDTGDSSQSYAILFSITGALSAAVAFIARPRRSRGAHARVTR